MTQNISEANILQYVLPHLDRPSIGNTRSVNESFRDTVDALYPLPPVCRLIRDTRKKLLSLQGPAPSLKMKVCLRNGQFIPGRWKESPVRRYNIEAAQDKLETAKNFRPMAIAFGEDFVAKILQSPRIEFRRYGTMVKWMPEDAITSPIMHGFDERNRPFFMMKLRGTLPDMPGAITAIVAYACEPSSFDSKKIWAREHCLSWHSLIGAGGFYISKEASQTNIDEFGHHIASAQTFADLLAGRELSVLWNPHSSSSELRTWQLSG